MRVNTRQILWTFALLSVLSSRVFAWENHLPSKVQPSQCSDVSLQVLGSGGPELDDGRASSAYLLWQQGRAVVMIDAGSASSLRFGEAQADFADIKTVLLSHLHTDHAADLPSFIKGSYFGHRDTNLTIYGPPGNDVMPDVETYVSTLLGKRGAFRYLSSYLTRGKDAYFIQAHTVSATPFHTNIGNDITVDAMFVHHGPIPALAWRVTINGCVAVFSGDTNDQDNTLSSFAKDADILVLHNAIEEGAGNVAANLHMTPAQIIAISEQSNAKRIVLSHYMKRSEAGRASLVKAIAQGFNGQVYAAQDLMTIPLKR